MITNVIVSVILACIIGGAIVYIAKAKKRGEKCIGCPYAKQCGSKCNCQSEKQTKQ